MTKAILSSVPRPGSEAAHLLRKAKRLLALQECESIVREIITKVESGQMRSRQTYGRCVKAIAALEMDDG